MRLIYKRAADLKPGDILEPVGSCVRRVFCYASQFAQPGIIQPITAPLTPQPPYAPGCPVPAPEVWRPDELVSVALPDEALTSEELDLLAEVARMQLTIGLDPVRQAAVEQLLNRVRPEAPSLEEMLDLAARAHQAILAGVAAPEVTREIEDVLDRARRSGVFNCG